MVGPAHLSGFFNLNGSMILNCDVSGCFVFGLVALLRAISVLLQIVTLAFGRLALKVHLVSESIRVDRIAVLLQICSTFMLMSAALLLKCLWLHEGGEVVGHRLSP